MCLVLEVGKVYVDGDGCKVKIIYDASKDFPESEYPMVGMSLESSQDNIDMFGRSGRWSKRFTPNDLIRLAPTPHPHAESMMLYAKDAAECDKPWLRWCFRHNKHLHWNKQVGHPKWEVGAEYSRVDQRGWPPEAC